MKVYLPNILQGSCLAEMSFPSAQVYVGGLVFVLYVCKESAVFEHINRDLVVGKDPVWVEASHIVVHVVR